jgi:hypothetical protein
LTPTYHIARARELVDIDAAADRKGVPNCCAAPATSERAAQPITGRSSTAIKAFTGVNATTFLALWRNCAMLYGYENAWHFAWFMMAGMSISIVAGVLRMIEILPKLSYGNAFRKRFADNAIVKQPSLQRALQAMPSAGPLGAVLRHLQRQVVRQSAIPIHCADSVANGIRFTIVQNMCQRLKRVNHRRHRCCRRCHCRRRRRRCC